MTMKPRDAIHKTNKNLTLLHKPYIVCWLDAARVVCLPLLILVCLMGTMKRDDASADDKTQVLKCVILITDPACLS